MVSPPVRLLGLLVPVLVIPLGLLALKVVGIVAIFTYGKNVHRLVQSKELRLLVLSFLN